MPDDAHQHRMETLLARLERRARTCRGIAPVTTAGEFLALARAHCGAEASPATLAAALETLWRHPEEAAVWANRALLASGCRPGPAVLGPANDADGWKRTLGDVLNGQATGAADQPLKARQATA